MICIGDIVTHVDGDPKEMEVVRVDGDQVSVRWTYASPWSNVPVTTGSQFHRDKLIIVRVHPLGIRSTPQAPAKKAPPPGKTKCDCDTPDLSCKKKEAHW